MKKFTLLICLFLFSNNADAIFVSTLLGSGEGGGATPSNFELGLTTPGGTEAQRSWGRKTGNSTGLPTAFTTPAGGGCISHGYWYGNTSDGGTNGTFTMMVVDTSGTQQGTCATGDIVDGSSPVYNEIVFSPCIAVSGSTEYRPVVYFSEEVDIFYDEVASGDGAWYDLGETATCGTDVTDDGTYLVTLTLANYDAHDLGGSEANENTYYATQTGAGSNSGGTGAWVSAPTTVGQAMSIAQFNNAANWTGTESAGAIDPGDVVYFSGTITSDPTTAGNGTSTNYITLDGLASGDCDAINDSCSSSAIISTAKISIQNDYIKIRDFVFSGQPQPYIEAASGDGNKVTGLTIENSRFSGTHQYNAFVRLSFASDVVIRNNRMEGDSVCTEWPGGQRETAIHIIAGSRMKIINNHILNAHHSVYISMKSDENGDGTLDYPSSGSYAIDPDAPLSEMEIAYNYLGTRCEEGISYDVGDTHAAVSTLEVDTVASISGASNEIITLNNSGGEWTGAGNIYSGLYMVSIAERQNSFGLISRIESQSDNVFTLDTTYPLSNLQAGDVVSISFAVNRNWVHHNRFYGTGYGNSTMLYEDSAFYGLFENNYVPPRNTSIAYKFGIRLHAMNDLFTSINSLTGTDGRGPTSYNIVRYNTFGRIDAINVAYNDYSWFDLYQFNNSVYNNKIHDLYADGEIHWYGQELYVADNTFLIGGGQATNNAQSGDAYAGTISLTDYTTAVPAMLYDLFPPNILSTSISGSTLTVVFTEAVTGCSSGDCGFTITDDGGATYPSLTYASGNTGATWTFTIADGPISTNAFLFYDGSETLVDGSGNEMYEWNVVGHDLNTEY